MEREPTDTPSLERPSYPRGEKVWLRAFEKDDIDAFLEGANSVETGAPAGYNGTMGRYHAEQWVEKRPLEGHGHGSWYWVISPIGSREFIGTIWLWNGENRLGGMELSIFVRASAGHGQGIGTDAIRAALDFGFGGGDTERIWMYTFAANTRSQRAFEKAGFQRDGVIRHIGRHNGEWIDGVMMSILRGEWEAQDRKRSWDYIAEAPATSAPVRAPAAAPTASAAAASAAE
jgi:RimJ/RimL family protein N-acetyltransferase